jgi:hypothetical protein
MYVRLGLAVAETGGFMKNVRYMVNWEMKTQSQLKQWYELIIGHIRTGPYGVYFALQEVFGVHAADFVAAKGHAKKPEGLQSASIPRQLQSGSSNMECDDE